MSDTVELAKQALADYFSAFAQGQDVPPARRHFLEGYLQALVDTGQLSLTDASSLVAEACRTALGSQVAEAYQRSDNASGRIVLHSHASRAPVFPGG